MNNSRRKRKKRECKQHREMVYEHALDKLVNGKCPPEYVHFRYQKLKEVR